MTLDGFEGAIDDWRIGAVTERLTTMPSGIGGGAMEE